MINLLPPDTKHQLNAARSNTLLLRYNILLGVVVALALLAIGFVYLYLSQEKARAEQSIADSSSRLAAYRDVEREASEFRTNLSTAKSILDGETTYTKAILRIAKVIPSGVILGELNLDPTTFGTNTTLNARAKSTNDAIRLKDSLQKSELFTNVSFQTVSSGDQGGNYPITVTMNATIDKKALAS